MTNASLTVHYRDGVLVLTPKNASAGPSVIRYESPHGKLPQPGLADCQDPKLGKGRRMLMETPERTIIASLYDNHPFLFVDTKVSNPTAQEVSHEVLPIARVVLPSGASSPAATWRTLGTGGMSPAAQALDSFAYLAVADPSTRNGTVVAWLTQDRGVGTFRPKMDHDALQIGADLEFGKLRVMPGKSRDTDTLILGFFPDVRIGLENYADAVAFNKDIQLKPKTGVYCSWYHQSEDLKGASDEAFVERNSTFAQQHLLPFGLGVYQLDDHWQAAMDGRPADKEFFTKHGPVKSFREANEFFPGGMKKVADSLRAKGFVPGLWFMPFSADSNSPADVFPPEIFAKDPQSGKPLANTRWSGTTIDATSPAGEAFLRDRFRLIRDWGYDYVKVDGLHSGTPSDNVYVHRHPAPRTLRPAVLHDPDQTFIEAYHRGLRILREEMPKAFILGCTTTQNMVAFAPTFGFLDASRVGPDNDSASYGEWKNVIVGAEYAGNLWFLNNRVWHNDPDPIYVRAANRIDKARWMASWLAVSGAMNSTSEIYDKLPADRLDLIKRTLPAHDLFARPVDILDREKPSVWIVGNERQHIVGLFNWSEDKSTVLSESLKRLGLPPQKTYEAFDFWGNKLLRPIQGKLESELPGAGCQVLSLRETAAHPQVISTSRHLTQGLVDLVSETWDPATLTLRGTSRMVAGDPYEIRIICPEGLTPVETADVTFRREGRLVRATFQPTQTGESAYSIAFRSGS